MDGKPKTALLAEYLADTSVGMSLEKLTEIWEAGIADNQTGRSMLGSLLAIPAFTYVEELHNFLKNHLLSLNKSKASSIGQIYLKAWKTADAERKQMIDTRSTRGKATLETMNTDLAYEGRLWVACAPAARIACPEVISCKHIHSLASVYENSFWPPDYRTELETTCIQDLIRCSLYSKRLVATYCLEALRPFMDKTRLLVAVDYMMCDLAEPLIWRCLDARNNEMRFNAISLLIAMFPMREEGLQPLEEKELMGRQLKALNECLFDDIEEIRITTTAGVCKVVTLFWEILLESDIRSFLLAFVDKLAWDAKSIGVRVAVYRALAAMLENPISHIALEGLLPKLAMGIHDRSEAVRSAVVDLLLDTRPTKILKFWKIVPIDHIIRRLAAETSPSICERIVRLLLPSYFPKDSDDYARLNRAESLLEANIVGARKFYQYAAKLAPVDVTVKQILLFIRCVYGCTKTARSDTSATTSNGDVSNDDSQISDAPADKTNDTTIGNSGLKPSDTPILVNFLDCAAILWTSIISELKKEENEEQKKLLHKQGCGMLLRCASFFDDPLIVDSLLVLIGCFTKASARYVSNSLNRQMKAIDDGGFDPKLHGSLVEAICYVQLDDIVTMVSKWWRSYSSPVLTSASNTPPPTKSKRVRISVPEIVDSSNPRLGIQVISYLLNRYGTRKYLLGAHVQHLRELESDLEDLWEHCMSLPETSIFDARWTAEVLKLRGTMVCLLCAKEGGSVEAAKFLTAFMDLLRVIVWPVYRVSTDEMNATIRDGDRHERAKTILQMSFAIWSDFIMCGLCNDTTIVLATELIKMVMDKKDTTFFVETAQLIYHILDYIRNRGIPSDVAEILRTWFEQIVQFSSENKDLFDGMDEVTRLVDRFSVALANLLD